MKLYHKSYGKGPPIVILHGLFGSGDNWRTIARMMEGEYNCVLADLRNHGRSPHDMGMNFESMAADVLELIHDLNLSSVTLLGHSMGGKVAMQMAMTTPEVVEQLMVVDIAPRQYPPHHAGVIRAIRKVDMPRMSDRAQVESVLVNELGPDQSTIQFLMKNLSRDADGQLEWKPNMPVILDAYDRLIDDVPLPVPFEGPTLFIRGEQSKYILEEDMTAIRKGFPRAELVTISGAGHWVHADAPEPFVEEVRSFLSRTE